MQATSKLTAICYRLFQGEEAAVPAAERGVDHDFGGELVLIFQNDHTLFVSWVDEPVQHAIGIKDKSHFSPDAELSDFNVSGSATWANMVGVEVSLRFVAADNQVLKVSSANGHLLLCSYERGVWRADQVMVCRQVPAPYDT